MTLRQSSLLGGWTGGRTLDLASFLIWIQVGLVISLMCHSSKVLAIGYVEEYLNNPDLCPPVGKIANLGFLFKQKIRLANYPNHTVVVKLSRWQDRNPSSAHLSFRCTFEVTAPKNHGIMMTIRSLYLRRYSQQASCIDYLKFKPERSSAYSPHICGEVVTSDKSEQPVGLIGPRFVYDPHAGLDVTILTDDPSPNDSQKSLEIELVFTATKACSIGSLRTGKLKQCTIKTPNSCIPADLFCDGYVNCGIEGDFGDDEKECADKGEGVDRAMSVFIFGMTALGTIVTVTVLILLIMCCCRKCAKKTSSPNTSDADAEQHLEANQPSTTPANFNTALRRPSTPTAPPDFTEMPEWRPSTPKRDAGDEDLPPSYKDLFPTSQSTTIMR